MGQLYEATPELRWENIPLDPFRLAAGSHIITTLNALSAERQGADLYELLGKFSAWIDGAAGASRIEIGTFRAQLQLLNWAGMLPDLSATKDVGSSIDTLSAAWLLPDVGFLEKPPEGVHDAIKFNAEALTVLVAALQGRFPEAAGGAARATVRQALNAIVRHELGRDLKTWRYYAGTFR